jgi:glycerol-3-phosphate acyltransferase PlsY
MGTATVLLAATTGYALGNVPVADLVARRASDSRLDLRDWGSGNPGAMNAARTLGFSHGLAVAGGDVAKAALAGSVGRRLAGPIGAHVGAVAAVVGHCYPAGRGRSGGKGVSASAGQCLATFPAYFPIDLVVGIAATAAVRPGLPGRHKALLATMAAAACWVAAGALWWRKRLPNGWGPPPSGALPLANAVTTAVILSRFVAASRRRQPDDLGPLA